MFVTRAPDRPYAEVGLLSVEGGDPEYQLTSLRHRAAREGCDATVALEE